MTMHTSEVNIQLRELLGLPGGVCNLVSVFYIFNSSQLSSCGLLLCPFTSTTNSFISL